MRWILAAAAVFALGLQTLHAQQDVAADFPNQPIKIVVCVPAGGGTDRTTRIVAEKLHQRWGQPVIIENRAGAAGNIGAEMVFRSKPDGYTLLAAHSPPLTSNKFLYKMSFDPANFTWINVSSKAPNVLLVRPDFPAKTAQEFVQWVKANPGKLNFASQGIGSTSHLTQALLASLLKADFAHVPYKGSAPALNDIVARQVDAVFMDLASAYILHQADKARIIAVVAKQRIGILPDVSTLDEIGVSVESGAWNGIVAPPNTPRPIVAKLNAAINDALRMPDVAERYAQLQLEAVPGTPEDMAAFVAEETKRWGDVIRSVGITAQ